MIWNLKKQQEKLPSSKRRNERKIKVPKGLIIMIFLNMMLHWDVYKHGSPLLSFS